MGTDTKQIPNQPPTKNYHLRWFLRSIHHFFSIHIRNKPPNGQRTMATRDRKLPPTKHFRNVRNCNRANYRKPLLKPTIMTNKQSPVTLGRQSQRIDCYLVYNICLFKIICGYLFRLISLNSLLLNKLCCVLVKCFWYTKNISPGMGKTGWAQGQIRDARGVILPCGAPNCFAHSRAD